MFDILSGPDSASATIDFASLEGQLKPVRHVNRHIAANKVNFSGSHPSQRSGLSVDVQLSRVVDGASNEIAALPQSATWKMMIGGFGLTGGTIRLRQQRPGGAPRLSARAREDLVLKPEIAGFRREL